MFRTLGFIAVMSTSLACGAVREKEADQGDSCYRPLESFCSGSQCPTYEQSVSGIRNHGPSSPACLDSSGRCTPLCVMAAQAGTCGGFRYTHRSDGYTGRTLYFDETGALVAAITSTDALVPGSACPGWQYYGKRFGCTAERTEEYCR